MAAFNPPGRGARTGAISATAVISATGLLASPAEAVESRAEAPASTHTVPVLHAPAADALHAPSSKAVVLVSRAPAAVPAAVKQRTHTVARGDTVWDLAKKYGSTVTAIVDANRLDHRATIHVGEKLVIPGSSAASVASAPKPSAPAKASTATGTHTVVAGDTVWDLSRKYSTTVHAIMAANKLGDSAVIHVGEKLLIPGLAGATTVANTRKVTATATSASASSGATSSYTVKSGDTLGAIASKFGSSVKEIARVNHISNPSVIRIGQRLTIPGGIPTGLVSATFLGRTYPAAVVGAANQNKATLNSMNVPTRAQMRSMVVKAAKKYGVDPALAQAVAYQESGFNMRAVSSANAIGVMQVIPSTGEWVSTMVGRKLNLLDPQDNVTAGVALLNYLTRNGRDLNKAIAGYYQGEAAVNKYGIYDSSWPYVNSIRALMKQF